MSAELDMSQYLDLFLQEAEEQLEILEQETLKLEQDPTSERMQIIFRAAHTLKGSSRAMNFSRFAELTHEMENVLDQLRNNTLSVTTEIADALLGCLDILNQMKESIASGQGDLGDCEALVKQLQGFTGSASSAAPAQQSSETNAQAGSGGGKSFRSLLGEDQAVFLRAALSDGDIFHAKFRLRGDCVMKFVRVFMAISVIEEQGELLITFPSREKLEEEDFETDFELFFQTKADFEEFKEKFAGISELEWHEVAKWDGQVGEPQPGVATGILPEPQADAAPATSPDASSQAAQAAKKTDTGQTVRVDVTRLDNLMNLVGELVIDRTRISQLGADLAAKYNDSSIDALAETVGHIARITSDLQDQIMKARMMPIETVFNRFPRVVRDLAQKLGKEIKLDMLGGETELDRSVIEVIGDPLLHILRNCVDHGVEQPEERALVNKPRQGHVQISARHQENHIVIEITDDGKGIDVELVKKKAQEKGHLTKEASERMTDKEALQLIFASGLSTAKEVSEVSGRGVGMDIVRSNIQKLGGLIDLETEVGKGSKFSLRLPLTLAIIRGLLVRTGEGVYVVPLGSVIETLLINRKEIQKVNNREVIVIRGVTTPLIHMRHSFGLEQLSKGKMPSEIYVVVVGLAEQRIGIVVDSLVGEQEVVIKSLSRYCGDIGGISGATILGDGNVALILDVNGVVNIAA